MSAEDTLVLQVSEYKPQSKFASTHHGPKPSPLDETKPVRMFRRNTGTIEAQVCHELETTGTPASPSTVKPALHYHELRGC